MNLSEQLRHFPLPAGVHARIASLEADRENAVAYAERIQSAAQDVLDAYQNRFETGTGNYFGPIDDEIAELRTAISKANASASGEALALDGLRWQGAFEAVLAAGDAFFHSHGGGKEWDALMDEVNRILDLDEATLIYNTSERPRECKNCGATERPDRCSGGPWCLFPRAPSGELNGDKA